jgi:sulfide dehydrogenase subunit beta
MGMGKEFRSGSDSGEVIRPESLFGPAAYKGTEIGSVSVPEFGEANCQKPCYDAGNVDPRNVASVCSPEKEPLFQIVTRYDFSDVTYLLEVRHPLLARASRPGQFVIVQSHEHGERIPLTIADFDHQKGTITLVIQAVGKTTKEMQRICVAGARLFALVGPMGHPTRIGKEMKVVCVGGGLGVAPVFPQLRAFKEKGAYVIGVVGFRSRSLIFWEEKFRKYCDELIVCTDDGSAGTKGFVTDGLKKALQQHTDVDQVIAIGPPVMMRACAELTRPHKVKTIVSLNPIMVDGTGMCGGCRVSVGGKMRFACVDGPDFDAHEVDFDELMRRQRRFVEDEKHALNEWLKNIQAPNTASPIEAVSKVDDPSARCAGVNQTDEPAL